jgi:hypothetical protein
MPRLREHGIGERRRCIPSNSTATRQHRCKRMCCRYLLVLPVIQLLLTSGTSYWRRNFVRDSGNRLFDVCRESTCLNVLLGCSRRSVRQCHSRHDARSGVQFQRGWSLWGCLSPTFTVLSTARNCEIATRDRLGHGFEICLSVPL